MLNVEEFIKRYNGEFTSEDVAKDSECYMEIHHIIEQLMLLHLRGKLNSDKKNLRCYYSHVKIPIL